MSAEPIEPAGALARADLPSRFLTVRVHDLSLKPSLTTPAPSGHCPSCRTAFPPVSGASKLVPSMAISLRPRSHAPVVPSPSFR